MRRREREQAEAKRRRDRRLLIGVGTSAAVLFAVAWVSRKPEPQRAPSLDRAPNVTAAELVAEYAENEVRGDRDFRGKRETISGRIARIETTAGAPELILEGDGVNDVACVMLADQTNRVAALRAGEKVSVDCTGDGWSFERAHGADCVLR